MNSNILFTNEFFQKDNEKFLESFETELNDTIQNVLDKFPDSNEKQTHLQKEKTFNSIHQHLTTIHIQKTLSKITFPSYPLFKFMDSFSGLFDEAEFEVTPEHIMVQIRDPSRICLLQVKLCNKSFEFYQEGKVSHYPSLLLSTILSSLPQILL